MPEFHDQIALVTGASSGIGRATAIRLARAGATVMLVGRREKPLAALASYISNQADETQSRSPSHISYIAADITVENDAAHIITETVNRFGKLDILVNAAGSISSGSIRDTTLAAWDELMHVNMRAVFHLMKLATPHLERTRGSIVNVSSVTGLRAFPNVLAYCVSKAAVDQLTRCAALELASAGVRVNAVNPGVVETNLHREGGMSENDYREFLTRSNATHPLGRTGTAEEVAELIYFLTSSQAAWITGVTYSIDGGRAQTCAR